MSGILQSAKSGKSRVGKAYYVRYLQGETLTRTEAIKAKCYECQGMGEIGDCDIEDCALYTYSPYRHSGCEENAPVTIKC